MTTFIGPQYFSRFSRSSNVLRSHSRRPWRSCTSKPVPPPADFHLISEEKIFHRYQTIFDRTVRYPNGNIVSYDVLGNPRSDFKSVFVFPFNTSTKTVTLLREYSPGRNKETFSFVAGMFESDKHATLEDAARSELSEEALLKGGELVGLTDHQVAADKYSLNDYSFYLCLNAEKDDTPLQRDAEEWITVVDGLRLTDIREMVNTGEFNTPNSFLAMLALDRLTKMGFK